MRTRIKPILKSIEESLSGDPQASWWEDSAMKFFVGRSKLYQTNIGGREVRIESREQLDGTTAWVVFMDGFVLGKDNEYYYEPMPSSRTDEFIENTRFDTKLDALSAFLEHEKRDKPSRLSIARSLR